MVVVVISVVVGLFSVLVAVLMFTHVLPPLQNFSRCRYYASQSLCRCYSPYSRDLLVMQHTPTGTSLLWIPSKLDSLYSVLPLYGIPSKLDFPLNWTPSIPDFLCTRLSLNWTSSKLDSLYTRLPLYQTSSIPDSLYTRLPLYRTPSIPDSLYTGIPSILKHGLWFHQLQLPDTCSILYVKKDLISRNKIMKIHILYWFLCSWTPFCIRLIFYSLKSRQLLLTILTTWGNNTCYRR